MTFGFGLGAGLKALMAARLGIETAGHNVANANTPGFSRQRVLQSATMPYGVARGFQIGTGVQVDDVRRIVDDGLERRLRLQLGLFGSAEVDNLRWREIEDAFNENGAGLGTSLTDMFGRIAQLQTDPSDRALRGGVVQGAKSVTQAFNLLATRFSELQESTFDEARGLLRQVNQSAAEIARLNREIVTMEANGSAANDLRDTREQHVREIAKMVDARAIERSSGAVDLLAGGYLLVSGTTTSPLNVVRNSQGRTEVRIGSSSQTVTFNTGRIASLLEQEGSQVPGLLADLDRLAYNLALEVNRVQTTGVPSSGPFRGLTSHYGVVDGDGDGDRGDELLSQSGFPFDIEHGELWVAVTREETGDVERHRLQIDPETMTLRDVAAAVDGLAHLNASVDPVGRLRITAEDGYGFDFSNTLDEAPDAFGSFGGSRPSFASSNRHVFNLSVPSSFTVDAGGTPATVNLTAADFADPSRATTTELVAAINGQLGTTGEARDVGGHLVLRSNTGGKTSTMVLNDGANSPLASIGMLTGVARRGQDQGVEVTVSGSYTGTDNKRLVFRADSDGAIGVTPNLTVGVFDENDNRVATLNVGRGVYSPGTKLTVLDGVEVAFGPGNIEASSNDVFALDTLHDSDSSDILVALGMNSLLHGNSSATLSVNSAIENDSDLFAAGLADVAGDAGNLRRLMQLRDRPLDALGNATIEGYHTDMVGSVGFETATARGALQAQDQLLSALEAERESISGVNLDEEMIDLVRYQQAFEAASRFINTVSELTQTLMNIAG